jgi:hypothetical protein
MKTLTFYETEEFSRFQKAVPSELHQFIFGSDHFSIPTSAEDLHQRTKRIDTTHLPDYTREFEKLIRQEEERIATAKRKIDCWNKSMNILKSHNSLKEAFEAIVAQ